MKIIGTLDTKGDGDMISEVLDQSSGLFDAIYVYEDDSPDNTYAILKNHKAVSRLWKASEFSAEEKGRYQQHRRGWPLEQVKKDFPYTKEEIWVVRLEGDRFFLNQSPKEIVERALKLGMDSRCGVMLDFRRHRLEGWPEEVDSFPNWKGSIRDIQRWFYIDDIHNCVAFKVCDYIDYKFTNRPRPWPGGCKFSDCNREVISTDMVFFEHHGRRSPKYFHWSLTAGNRALSSKVSKRDPLWDLSTPSAIFNTMLPRFQPYRVFPYTSWESVKPSITLFNNKDFRVNKQLQRYYFWGIEEMFKQDGCKLPSRKDYGLI